MLLKSRNGRNEYSKIRLVLNRLPQTGLINIFDHRDIVCLTSLRENQQCKGSSELAFSVATSKQSYHRRGLVRDGQELLPRATREALGYFSSFDGAQNKSLC